MKKLLTKQAILKYALGGTIGAIIGLGYFYFVGCHSGTCAITSSAINSSIYGFAVGVLVADSIYSKKNLPIHHEQ
jgi:hypothetical protein